MGLNPSTVYYMDMTFFTLRCCFNCIVCLKKPKINEKEAGVGPFLERHLAMVKPSKNLFLLSLSNLNLL